MTTTDALNRRSSFGNLRQGELAAALILIVGAATQAPVVAQSVLAGGWTVALDGGGVSWVVWFGLAAAVRLALKAEAEPVTRLDIALALACAIAVVLPAHFLVNLAATGLALRYTFDSRAAPALRGAGAILLALIFSTFWSYYILKLTAGPVAFIDAWWVRVVFGAEVVGNVVSFRQEEGSFLLAAGCTSVANASLALLLWLSISRSFRPEGSRWQWLVGLGVLASAVAINVIRLGLMSQNLNMFDQLHNSQWVGLVTAASGLAWGIWDARREIFA